MRTILKSSIAAALFLVVVLASCAGQGQKNNNPMDKQELNLQQHDTTRLLSVANLERSDSNGKIIAWFFETPRVFEFNLDNKEAQSMYDLLNEAKEKQLPVNVSVTSNKEGNSITKVVPATEAQLAAYKKEKAGREQPTPVPAPKNN